MQDGVDTETDGHVAHHAEIEREVITAQRVAIIEMRERGEIDNAVLRSLQADLDMALSRPALNGANEPQA